MYNVYQHWDPLKVCILGRSYGPEFYNFIKNSKVRSVMERIAIETEEDYERLSTLLKSFGVKVLRPNVHTDFQDCLEFPHNNRITPPPMTPRDYSIMLGSNFFWKLNTKWFTKSEWDIMKGVDWPEQPPKSLKDILTFSKFIQDEIWRFKKLDSQHIVNNNLFQCLPLDNSFQQHIWGDVIDEIKKTNTVYTHGPADFPHLLNSAMTTRVGKDIYLGTSYYGEDISVQINSCKENYPQYRWHMVDSGGHSDSTFCPVVPGLILSLFDIPTYKNTFPDWEVVYLPNQSWKSILPFHELKKKNKGKWWVPGEELNDDFTNYVESWLDHWVGYVEETVFDVNMLVIDEKNVVCNNYNEKVFKAFERFGITPHVINFRHRYFWDGGLHCITSDIHREGTMKDYFPERG